MWFKKTKPHPFETKKTKNQSEKPKNQTAIKQSQMV